MVPTRLTIWLFFFGLCAPAFALEPIDTGISQNWWNSETDKAAYRRSFTVGAQNWWNQPWGSLGDTSLTEIYTESQEKTQPVNLNLRHRLLSTADNTIIDAGIGFQEIGLDRNDSRNGLRLSLGGRMAFGDTITLYGESAWLPGLVESEGIDTISGLHFETGVVLNPLPFLSIRAAYRRFNLDYTLTNGGGDYSTTEGIIIGTGIHW